MLVHVLDGFLVTSAALGLGLERKPHLCRLSFLQSDKPLGIVLTAEATQGAASSVAFGATVMATLANDCPIILTNRGSPVLQAE